jgi:ACR3 family arsenite efflux pump ArsB
MWLPIIAILIWIGINYITWWLPFSTLLCVFAGIFIMMPAFLNIEYRDITWLKNKKKIIIKSLISNGILLPAIAILIGIVVFHNNISLLFGIIFLSLISGGGLMMSWIHKTKWDSKTGLRLFILNMIVFIGMFFIFEYIVQHIGINLVQWLSCSSQTLSCIGNMSISPINGILILIIAPFLISRWIRIFTKTSERIKKYIGIIWQIATFIIISYIFALEHMHSIFQTPMQTIILATAWLLLFYTIVIWINYLLRIRKQINKENIAWFRMGISRFITMWFVFSFLYTQTFGSDFMVIFILAYLIQIPVSLLTTKYIIKKPN